MSQGLIAVKRDRDGKLFTSDMSLLEGIYEIHFCTSYTQVMVQELDDTLKLVTRNIICDPIGTKQNPIDLIAIEGDDTGKLIIGGKQ